MVDAPGLVESLHSISADHLIADEAEEAKELLEMVFAVRLTLLLEVPRSQKRLLTSRTHKVIHVPGLAQGVHNPFLDGTPGRKRHALERSNSCYSQSYFYNFCLR